MTAPVSLCPNRSALVIAPFCVKSHDQRALDATLRERFRYLLRIARLLGTDSAAIETENSRVIAYEFHAKLGGHNGSFRTACTRGFCCRSSPASLSGRS